MFEGAWRGRWPAGLGPRATAARSRSMLLNRARGDHDGVVAQDALSADTSSPPAATRTPRSCPGIKHPHGSRQGLRADGASSARSRAIVAPRACRNHTNDIRHARPKFAPSSPPRVICGTAASRAAFGTIYGAILGALITAVASVGQWRWSASTRRSRTSSSAPCCRPVLHSTSFTASAQGSKDDDALWSSSHISIETFGQASRPSIGDGRSLPGRWSASSATTAPASRR